MSKTSVFTTITPLPAGVTRQTVLDTYHNHTEMIDLNPLVVERFKCKPPKYAPEEELNSIWYTIKDKVSYLPANLATSTVSYHACFHDLPGHGLQTHVYAPLGLDIQAKWSVGGSLPGEPKQPAELGLGIPSEGLYIREDVKMKCNVLLLAFVKKTFKESHGKLVGRLVEKANEGEERRGLGTSSGDIVMAPPEGHRGYGSPSPQRHENSMDMGDMRHGSGSGTGNTYSPDGSPAPARSSAQRGFSGSPHARCSDHRVPSDQDQLDSRGGELLSTARYDPRQQQQQGPQVPPKNDVRYTAELPG